MKKRTGHLEYRDDPEGNINLLNRSFGDKYTGSIVDTIRTFSKNHKIILFTEWFCEHSDSQVISESVLFCKNQLIDCILKEKTHFLTYFLMLYGVIKHVERVPLPTLAQDLRVLLGFYSDSRNSAIPRNMLTLLKIRLEDSFNDDVMPSVDTDLHLNNFLTASSAALFYSRSDPICSTMQKEVLEDIFMKNTISQSTIENFSHLLSSAGV